MPPFRYTTHSYSKKNFSHNKKKIEIKFLYIIIIINYKMSNYDTSIPYVTEGNYLELFVPRSGDKVPLSILYGLKYNKKNTK